MAPKRSNNLDVPPSASSDESSEDLTIGQEVEEGESDSEEEQEESQEESEDEEEQDTPFPPPVNNKQPSIKKPVSTPKPQSSSEFESDEGSDSELGSNKTQQSPTVSQFTIKPIVPSKSTEGSAHSKKPTVLAIPAKRPAGKEENGTNSTKKKSKMTDNDEEEKVAVSEKKGSGVTRVWSADDEIAILKGMFDYHTQKGSDPSVDMGAFYEFVKGSLHAEVSKTQLTDKIYRLKKKYRNAVKKGETGEARVFWRTRDYRSFEFSKKIWGGGTSPSANGKDENVKSNKSKAARKSEEGKEIVVREEGKNEVNCEKKNFCAKYPRLSESFELDKSLFLSLPEGVKNIVKEKMCSIGSTKAQELEKKWQSLRVKEFELYMKRLELVREQSALMLDVIKSSRS